MLSLLFGSISSLLFVGVLFAVALTLKGGGAARSAGPTLVLRRFQIRDSSDGPLLEISGRATGIIGWLLTTTKLGQETTLTIADDALTFTASRLAGEVREYCPFDRIASTHCAYSKPLWALATGLFFALGALYSLFDRSSEGFFAALLFSLIGFAVYWHQERIVFGIETTGGRFLALAFKPSLIENVRADLDQARRAFDLLNADLAANRRAVAARV